MKHMVLSDMSLYLNYDDERSREVYLGLLGGAGCHVSSVIFAPHFDSGLFPVHTCFPISGHVEAITEFNLPMARLYIHDVELNQRV